MRRQASIAALLSLTAAPALAAPTVVTDIVPTGALVQAVMGDLGGVRVLLPQGASAHHYQMRPSDAQALQDADLVVWMGPELAPWLDRAAGNLSDDAQLRLLGVEGVTLRSFSAGGERHDHDHGHEHGDDHEHADAHAHDHGDHDHSGNDPHAWLNPDNAAPWVDAIVASLSEQDPENAATYRSNADAIGQRIEALDTTLTKRLAPHADQRFIVFHDAYGYFTEHFGLQPAIPVSLGDASTPSAARIEGIQNEIARSGATCAFPEYAHDAGLVETVIEGSDVRLGGELSPAGGDLAPGAGQYEALLTAMADTMIACFEVN
ncbi:zinc ABC transporter substrate-binding protein [Paracoccus beibuensis]|uniref:zinc ABC transporter substrate-binding protein n=1 Tax=Paracoccus beibuensis TaxID=547602 RepID=UPI002240A054|nr:zinc ABC transporter substrate-binding protein [Paracoccus beibuensis]